MKQLTFIIILGIQCLLLISCSSDDDSGGLIIEISEEYNITENDIEFYDSSTCILFLKEPINLKYRFGVIPNVNYEDFSFRINEELIFSGVFFPANVAAPSPTPIFIGCYDNDSLNSDIIQFEYIDYPINSVDKRNDDRIIEWFNHNKQLRNGITCSIENIELSSINDSILNIELSIKNNDDYSYLIPDLTKISSDQFYMLTGGFRIKNLSTEEYISQKLDNYNFDKNIMSLDNLVILEGMGKETFSITAKYTSIIKKGSYSCNVQYSNTMYLTFIDLELNQNNYRVWIGESNAKIDFEIK